MSKFYHHCILIVDTVKLREGLLTALLQTKRDFSNLYVHWEEELEKMTIVLNNFFTVDLVGNSLGRRLGFLLTPVVYDDLPVMK